MALRQRVRHAINEDVVVEEFVDVSKRGVPQLVAVGQEDFATRRRCRYARRTMAPPLRLTA